MHICTSEDASCSSGAFVAHLPSSSRLLGSHITRSILQQEEQLQADLDSLTLPLLPERACR